MSLLGESIIAFGVCITLLSIFSRPGTLTKPADRADHGTKEKAP